jgi:hypothetical protein
MFKLVVMLLALASGASEPSPVASIQVNRDFATEQDCKEAAPAFMQESGPRIAQIFAARGIRIVGAQYACPTQEELDNATEQAEPKGEKI